MPVSKTILVPAVTAKSSGNTWRRRRTTIMQKNQFAQRRTKQSSASAIAAGAELKIYTLELRFKAVTAKTAKTALTEENTYGMMYTLKVYFFIAQNIKNKIILISIGENYEYI